MEGEREEKVSKIGKRGSQEVKRGRWRASADWEEEEKA